jgi:hypothetical protein
MRLGVKLTSSSSESGTAKESEVFDEAPSTKGLKGSLVCMYFFLAALRRDAGVMFGESSSDSVSEELDVSSRIRILGNFAFGGTASLPLATGALRLIMVR